MPCFTPVWCCWVGTGVSGSHWKGRGYWGPPGVAFLAFEAPV